MGFVADWRDMVTEQEAGNYVEKARAARGLRRPLNEAFALAAHGAAKRWFVATAHNENRAADALAEWGVELWQPRRRVTLARRRGQAARDVERPLFDGYLFLRIPEAPAAFHAVLTVADGLLGSAGRPAPQEDGLIAALRLASGAGVFDDTTCRRRARLEAALKRGEALKIGVGPFAGLLARAVEGWKGGATARLSVALFGGLTAVTLPVDDLRMEEE